MARAARSSQLRRMEDEQQLQRNRVQARRIVEENVSVEMDQTEIDPCAP